MCVCNTFLEHNSVHKYTRVGVSRDDIEMNSVIDFGLVMMRNYTMGDKSVKSLRMSILDHYVVLCKIKLSIKWKHE